MAYSNQIKEDAFGIYCTEISFEDIATEMTRRYPEDCANITRQTIATWEKKYNWEARRDVIARKAREKLDAKRISKRAELINDLDNLQRQLLSHAQKLNPKSMEGAVNSLIGLSKWITELRGERGSGGGVALEKVIPIIFEVLAEDEKISQRLQERQQFFLEKIQERIEQNA